MTSASRHVLLVEDEPGTMMTVSLLLEMMGYRVSKATNGRRALEELAVERPDIVVTDFMMPHLDGVGLINAMHADAQLAEVPVILTSAALPPEIDARSVAEGFLVKPYRIDALVKLIESLLQK